MIGLLVLRLVVGGLFIGHGAQKLFGLFGGHGLEGTGQFFESIGMRPGRRHAAIAGGAEFGGGTLMVLGCATPLAATLLTGTMTTAIWQVHRRKGPWMTEGGYEYNLVLIAAAFALSDAGPGRFALRPNPRGLGWALGELAAGTGGAAAVSIATKREQAREAQGDGAAQQQG
jgi:putative oxidoreductase